ncbi:Uncharacterised protein [Clostridium sporogenes]|uniref:Uncharacterized protein n=1 Tax=Clostridium sporogenes TaxID=1509 RepID=A0A7U4JPW9_CLOSG|nr:hypothetical protein [Clostridium sporogenes]AKC63127.1 hypothetical protein CLSPO_c24070 [Clostridium sporogenes]AKJ90335.1 hypothetical protein CLSPOx_12070 [Clostridium sporogenes]KCZ67814.1 hypothetical protein CSPO_7c01570 [Clostridium sporogenes]OOO65515.1 hypothetical protein BS099_14635 [Clostridium sporogenes]SQC03994.1 Uncharacterised protein [Clostridium sporogenes]
MNFSEKLASYVIKRKFKNCEIHFNDQQSKGEVDFELKMPHKQYKIPMEVTTSVEEQSIKEINEVIRNNERLITRKTGRNGYWAITLNKNANVNKIKKQSDKIDDYLYLLEENKIKKFYCESIYSYPKCISDKIRELSQSLWIDGASRIG